MGTELTTHDLDFIQESLTYTKKEIENSDNYPSNEFRQQRLKELNEVVQKIRQIKQERSEL